MVREKELITIFKKILSSTIDALHLPKKLFYSLAIKRGRKSMDESSNMQKGSLSSELLEIIKEHEEGKRDHLESEELTKTINHMKKQSLKWDNVLNNK